MDIIAYMSLFCHIGVLLFANNGLIIELNPIFLFFGNNFFIKQHSPVNKHLAVVY